MMKPCVLVPGLMVLLMLISCNEQCKKLESTRERFEQYPTEIQSFILSTPAEVVLHKDTFAQDFIEIFAQAEVYNAMLAEVKGKRMEMSMDACFKNQEAILINATFKALKRVKFSSAGNISSGTLVNEDTISLENTGLGDIDFVLKSKQVSAHLTSSGDISLAGSTSHSICMASGSGEINAFNLYADTVKIHTLGNGIIEVHAGHYLEVNFWEPTIVRYRGNPEFIVQTGEGEIIDANL